MAVNIIKVSQSTNLYGSSLGSEVNFYVIIWLTMKSLHEATHLKSQYVNVINWTIVRHKVTLDGSNEIICRLRLYNSFDNAKKNFVLEQGNISRDLPLGKHWSH